MAEIEWFGVQAGDMFSVTWTFTVVPADLPVFEPEVRPSVLEVAYVAPNGAVITDFDLWEAEFGR